ncbi:MAG: flagellar biosynthesis anti-sigma factor FlgM [Deltaproteobacteria bacterium]|nr:flagellar biosynthesis anti-sigma factor FlgM [Deltaproteobacteria bacterium]
MKVTNTTNPEIIKAYNANAAQQTTHLNEANRTTHTHQQKQTSVVDRVDISTDAQLFREIKDAVNLAPDVRMDKVTDIQKALDGGNYKPNLTDIAAKLLDPDISARI